MELLKRRTNRRTPEDGKSAHQGRSSAHPTGNPPLSGNDDAGPASRRHFRTPKFHLWASTRLLQTSAFFNWIPGAFAGDGGDDLSNNLASDLAPVLALFGEQVAKQYMSHSTSLLEDVIFALAPLGVITAMTSAIRVGGPGWLKALIGRAREGTGNVELEVMSSTSQDVAEMFNGEGVVRVLGKPSIVEIYYKEIANQSPSITSMPSLASASLSALHEYPTVQFAKLFPGQPYTFHNFASAKEYGVLIPSVPDRSRVGETIASRPLDESEYPPGSTPGHRRLLAHRPTLREGASGREAATPDYPPSIMLNIGARRVSNLLLMLVAFIGLVLQAGVIIMAGFSAKNSKFKIKDTEFRMAPRFSFPTMAVGTALLAMGMFMCALIVNRSTTERVWQMDSDPGDADGNVAWRLGWIQRGGEVNDQHFDSYLMRRRPHASPSGIFPKIWAGFTHPMTSDAIFEVRTSQKVHGLRQHQLTSFAIFLAFFGFVAQFTGLRGLNWIVSVSQLGVIGIMSGLRAMIRRNLAVHVVEDENLRTLWRIGGRGSDRALHKQDDGSYSWPTGTHYLRLRPGYELDEAAQELGGCAMMSVVIAEDAAVEDPTDAGSAETLLAIRCRLSNLSSWDSPWKIIVQQTVDAVEGVLNVLSLSDHCPTKERDFDLISCEINVEHARDRRSWFPRRGTIYIDVTRKWSLTRGYWTPWKVKEPEKVEAIMGLWMLFLSESHPPGDMILRVLHMGSDISLTEATKLFRYWVPSDGDLYHLENKHWASSSGDGPVKSWEGSTLGSHTRSRLPSAALGYEMRGAELSNLCGQFLVGEILSSISKQYFSQDSSIISGHTSFRLGGQRTRSSFGLRNSEVDAMVKAVEESGLASERDAYITVVPPLARYKRLPEDSIHSSSVYPEVATQRKQRLHAGRYQEADALLHYCLDIAATEISPLERSGNWDDAARVYTDFYEFFQGLDGCQDFRRTIDEAISHFVQWAYLMAPRTDHHTPPDWFTTIANVWWMTDDQLDSDGCRIPRLTSWDLEATKYLNCFAPDNLHLLAAAEADGTLFYDCAHLGVFPEPVDCWGRTAIILASRQGHLTMVRQLVSAGYIVDAKDREGKSALHHAACRGHLTVLRFLASQLYNTLPQELNIADRSKLSPMDYAFKGCNTQAIDILRFYGSNPSEKSEKKLTLASDACSGITYSDLQPTPDLPVLGSSALYLAIGNGAYHVAEHILNEGLATESERQDALGLAAARGSLELMDLLWRHTSDLDTPDKDGWPPLFYACANGHYEIVERLVNDGCNLKMTTNAFQQGLQDMPYYSALQAASHQGTIPMVRKLLYPPQEQARADVNDMWTEENTTFATALHAAAHAGNLEIVKILLDAGARIDIYGGYYHSVLQSAAVGGSSEVIQFLLKHGADVSAPGGHHGSAQMAAVRSGNYHLMGTNLLLCDQSIGPVLCGVDKVEGRSLFSWVASSGDVVLVKKLINQLGRHHKRTVASRELAVNEGKSDSLNSALDPPNHKGKQVRTALSTVAEDGHTEEEARALSQSNPQDSALNFLDHKDKEGRTALSRVAEEGHTEVVRMLLQWASADVKKDSKNGLCVDVNTTDKDNRTPLRWAIQKSNFHVVHLILECPYLSIAAEDQMRLNRSQYRRADYV